MDVKLIEKSAFQGIGIMWQGTFKQADQGEIRKVLHQFRQQILSDPVLKDNQSIYGISVHNIPNGFTYYICVEENDVYTSHGLSVFKFEENTYAALDYKGSKVQEAYFSLYKWIEEHGYQVNDQHIGQIDAYPIRYDPLKDDPELTIMVPIKI